MNNVLRQIDIEDAVIYTNQKFSDKLFKECLSIYKTLSEEGKIKGKFNEDKWMLFTGKEWKGIKFSFDEIKYSFHFKKMIDVEIDDIRRMLRCFAIYCHGVYISTTISRNKVGGVIKCLEQFGNIDFYVNEMQKVGIEEFLNFISIEPKKIIKILAGLKVKKSKGGRRKLKPVINYMAIEDAVKSLYEHNLDDDTFIKWFPIFFWVQITFIMPLRATEMLLTPYKCIERRGNEVLLSVRRTLLKNRLKNVSYDVDEDYKIFEYKFPDNKVIEIIEKYIDLTKDKKRKYLFMYDDSVLNNGWRSLAAFNRLLSKFMDEFIMHNEKYEYAKYASGIEYFEYVTAGDSRPIAMVNLYFSDVSADICRQLANHTNIDTSYGYYTNISEIINASSVMQLQNKYNKQPNKTNFNSRDDAKLLNTKSSCTSEKKARGSFEDCDLHHPADECVGCKYYNPTESELDEYLDNYKSLTDNSAKKMIDFLENANELKANSSSITELFLEIQKNAVRYRTGTDVKAKEKLEEWERNKSLQRTYC